MSDIVYHQISRITHQSCSLPVVSYSSCCTPLSVDCPAAPWSRSARAAGWTFGAACGLPETPVRSTQVGAWPFRTWQKKWTTFPLNAAHHPKEMSRKYLARRTCATRLCVDYGPYPTPLPRRGYAPGSMRGFLVRHFSIHSKENCSSNYFLETPWTMPNQEIPVRILPIPRRGYARDSMRLCLSRYSRAALASECRHRLKRCLA